MADLGFKSRHTTLPPCSPCPMSSAKSYAGKASCLRKIRFFSQWRSVIVFWNIYSQNSLERVVDTAGCHLAPILFSFFSRKCHFHLGLYDAYRGAPENLVPPSAPGGLTWLEPSSFPGTGSGTSMWPNSGQGDSCQRLLENFFLFWGEPQEVTFSPKGCEQAACKLDCYWRPS